METGGQASERSLDQVQNGPTRLRGAAPRIPAPHGHAGRGMPTEECSARLRKSSRKRPAASPEFSTLWKTFHSIHPLILFMKKDIQVQHRPFPGRFRSGGRSPGGGNVPENARRCTSDWKRGLLNPPRYWVKETLDVH